MRDISLFNLRKRANECLISEKRVFAHFGLISKYHSIKIPKQITWNDIPLTNEWTLENIVHPPKI